MVATATLEGEFKRVVKTLVDVKTKQLPFAQSKSLGHASKAGKIAYARSIKMQFDEPLPIFTKGEKNKSIWIQFASKNEIRATGEGGAKVWMRGVGSSADRNRIQETFHRQAEGTPERRTPLAAPIIVRPSRRLEKERKIKGTPLRLDRHGNIVNYNLNVRDKILKDKTGKYFEVRVGNIGRGRNGNGLKLKPGLYMRVLRKRKYTGKRHRVTKRKRGPYRVNGNADRKLETVGIVTLLRYKTLRQFKKKWEFRPSVVKAMRKAYDKHFLDELEAAILGAKPNAPSGRRFTGSLNS